MFICGSFSHHQEDDDIDSLSPCSTPKRSRRSGSYKIKESKNPYANRGLDKFYALLSQLEEQKQKIYTQKGAEDISIVRFVISNDNEIKPLVVKQPRDRIRHSIDSSSKEKPPPFAATPVHHHLLEAASSSEKRESPGLELAEQRTKTKKKKNYYLFDLKKLKQPYYYLPVILILILMLLAIYGRSFAILCTSIGWYLIPTIRGGGSSSEAGGGSNTTSESRKAKRKQKKEYTRSRLSEKTLGRASTSSNINYGSSSSPTSVIAGPADIASPRKNHGHRRSF